MNRSFIYGIAFASSTWCFSLYLYWLLQQPTASSISNSISPQRIAVDNAHSHEQIAQGKMIANNRNSIPVDRRAMLYQVASNEKSHVKEKLFVLEKLQKWKKEQKFRKISQKLIDEIKPIETDNGTGGKHLSFFFVGFSMRTIN